MDDPHSQTSREPDSERARSPSAHELVRLKAAELNRRLHAFENRMLEQFEQLACELDGGQGTICADLAEIERQLAQCEEPHVVERVVERIVEVERPVERIVERPVERATNDDHERELADLRQRYDMAISDIRDLKKQIASGERAGGRSAAPAAPAAHSGPMDWEAQKRRLLASLESDEEAEPHPEPERAEERLQIQEVIRTTDRIVRDKQAEIDELREQLETASQAAPSAEMSQSHAAALDASEIIQLERAKLQGLEADLQECLRKAEIELSVERAHLARVAAELEDKQRGFADQQSEVPAATHLDASGKAKKPQRKWMARLGLNEDSN